ncbi:hypothetical protein JJD41_19660 [Oxynema sp. CENA135]|uniref:hypothetical protein n=1 Tax=Oxynema sp. CENA135 TaxID=984206 RepID=UPI001909DE60|nr:hypothetical protein [Oxynema sp. CENA135]MBK4732070.1 hypothetical protein [Oxynema sp. CENA135]
MTPNESHPIHEQLKEIFRQALHTSSPKERKRLRRKGLHLMMQAPKECFWRGYAPLFDNDLLYLEASDKAWEYIERKINGRIRGKATAQEKAYDPDKGDASPLTLWNRRCKGIYKDLRQKQKESIHPHPKDPRTGEALDINTVEAEPESVPLLERVREELETDPTGVLKTTWVRKTPPPPITAQQVLLKLYDLASCGEKWTLSKLAKAFDLPAGSMNSTWKRKLKPLLEEMGDRLRRQL